jgi:hypothetical protein
MILSPDTPLVNSIIIYIFIMVIIILIKPNFLYCHKTNEFKKFGLDEHSTILPLPCVCIGSGILIYCFFTIIQTLFS